MRYVLFYNASESVYNWQNIAQTSPSSSSITETGEQLNIDTIVLYLEARGDLRPASQKPLEGIMGGCSDHFDRQYVSFDNDLGGKAPSYFHKYQSYS